MHLTSATGLRGTSAKPGCLPVDPTPNRMRIFILFFVLLPLPAFADHYDRILEAIAKVETGVRPNAVGQLGERSRFQIMPTTWARFSRMDQHTATATETMRVARRVLTEIEAVHLRRGLRVDVYGLALGWNAGPWARKYTMATLDYAERVEAVMALPEEA